MYFTSLYLSFLSTCFSLHWIEAFWVLVLHLNVLKLFKKNYTLFLCIVASQYMYFTSMHWSFLSTCTSFHIIETSWVHAHQFTVLNCFEYRFLTSPNWILLCTCASLHWIIFLITYNILHCTEASWNPVPHFAILTIFENVLCFTISNLLNSLPTKWRHTASNNVNDQSPWFFFV